MLYQADRVVQENAELIPPELRKEIDTGKEAVSAASRNGDIGALRSAMDRFNETLQKVGQAIYQTSGASPGGEGGRQAGQKGGSDDDVVDAEYREVE